MTMPLLIRAIDESAPPPRATVLELTCDGDHGLFAAEAQSFHGPSLIEQWSAAIDCGWKETRIGVRRVFLGPRCSGKKTA